MIYIISGASRSGKSIAARNASERIGVPYVPVDSLMMGFMKGMPSSGIHDKLWPHEIAEKMWSFLEATCENMIDNEIDYIFEGEAFLPGNIRSFMDRHPGKVRACFLGYGEVDVKDKIADVLAFPNHKNDWLVNMDEKSIEKHIRNMQEYSSRIRIECSEHSIEYFDTSFRFSATVEEAVDCLKG